MLVVASSTIGGSLVLVSCVVRGNVASLSHRYSSILGARALLAARIPALSVCWVAYLLLGSASSLELLFRNTSVGGDAVYYVHLFWIFGQPEV